MRIWQAARAACGRAWRSPVRSLRSYREGRAPEIAQVREDGGNCIKKCVGVDDALITARAPGLRDSAF
jgi:hypothetical protein